ncbi:MAG: hypothetical protein KGY54_01550 [Oleiphilaceae bacterium]|nr:hypothetical protein [Oleiphilaceae bacterium]
MTRIAINGLGRIGRATLKLALDNPALEVVAVNDLIDVEQLIYLLRYDSAYGRYEKDISSAGGEIVINQQAIRVCNEKDPENLPWQSLEVDVVLECTGVFTSQPDLAKHLKAGAKCAILSAPPKGEGKDSVDLVVVGVNDSDAEMFSTASCTTNCITPVMEILHRRIGVSKAVLNTTHAYTSSQQMVDTASKKPERGRAGAANLVPTSTGAAKATTKILTDLQGKFDGLAIRAPILVGSISDITLVTERGTSASEINDILREEAGSDRYRGIVGVTDDPIVSADIVMDPRAAIVDLGLTKVVADDLVKVMVWYDNEWGYAAQMVRQAEKFPGS